MKDMELTKGETRPSSRSTRSCASTNSSICSTTVLNSGFRSGEIGLQLPLYFLLGLHCLPQFELENLACRVARELVHVDHMGRLLEARQPRHAVLENLLSTE